MAEDKKTPEKAAEPSPFQEPYKPYGKDSVAATEPVVAPDGHVNLSAEDIKERDGNG